MWGSCDQLDVVSWSAKLQCGVHFINVEPIVLRCPLNEPLWDLRQLSSCEASKLQSIIDRMLHTLCLLLRWQIQSVRQVLQWDTAVYRPPHHAVSVAPVLRYHRLANPSR